MVRSEYITTDGQLDAVLPVLCAARSWPWTPRRPVSTRSKTACGSSSSPCPTASLWSMQDRCPCNGSRPCSPLTHLLAFHNAKFDLKFLRAAGLPWPVSPVFDTMLAAQLLGAGTAEGMLKECGLAAAAQRYLSIELDKALQTSDWTGLLTPAQLCYAARDAQVTLQLVSVLQQALVDAGLVQVAAIECQCVPALAWLELAGVPLDAQRWRDRANEPTRPKRSKPSSAHPAQSRNGSAHLFPKP